MSFKEWLNEKSVSDKDINTWSNELGKNNSYMIINITKSKKIKLGKFKIIDIDPDGGYNPVFTTDSQKKISLNDIEFDIIEKSW